MTRSSVTTKANKARILIVEDSLGIARALNRTLSLPQGGGHWVEIHDSGEAALERLRSAHFDLLITDLRLPGMNGLAVLEHAHQIRPETRSILITAFGSPGVEERARHLANVYLPKPFRLHDLIRIVQRVLDEPVAHKQPFLDGDIEHHRDAAQRHTADITTMSKRKAAYLKVLACDLDGTLVEQGQIAASTWEILRQARSGADDMRVILVTSHTLDNYADNVPYTIGETATTNEVALCDAVVAENGAQVYFPQQDTVTALPTGANKGTGLRQAVRELGYSPRNVVACGDAENDRSLFQVSELAVAMSNAPADIQAMADAVLPQANGDGVQVLIAGLLSGRIPDYLPRPNRRLLLGHRTSQAPVYLDPFALVNSNMGIFGASHGDGHGNKLDLITSLVEKLSKHEYQLCIIDPKGTYPSLKTEAATDLPSQLLGGPTTHLPPVADVIGFCESNHTHIVLDLSVYTTAERTNYVRELLPAMQNLRTRLGRPHWFLIEDIHSLCTPDSSQLTGLLLNSLQAGGFGLASDHPSQMPTALLESLDCCLLTRLSQPEEIVALRPFLTKHTGGPAALSQLPSLPPDQAYLCLGDIEEPSLSTKGFIKLLTRS